MTPKEKAIELYNKFRNEMPVVSANARARKCASICVDELRREAERDDWQYWDAVSHEISKL